MMVGIVGCGSGEPLPPAPKVAALPKEVAVPVPAPDPTPQVGDRVILPRLAMLDLWSDLNDMRKQLSMLKAGTWDRENNPEHKFIDQTRIGLLTQGDMVVIYSMGEDYAEVEAVVDQFGERIGKHGYVARWW
jgi:hypothetical protein